jgi:hypothetical protein
LLLGLEGLLSALVAEPKQTVQIQLLGLVGGAAQLLGHLLHQVLDHAHVGNLSVIEVVFHFVQILLREAFVGFVNRSLPLIFARMVKHALFIAIHTKSIKKLDTRYIFFQVV